MIILHVIFPNTAEPYRQSSSSSSVCNAMYCGWTVRPRPGARYYWRPIGSRIMRNRFVPKWMTLIFA